VIDDENISTGDATLGRLPRSTGRNAALFAEAVAMLGTDLVPHVVVRQARQIGERAIGGARAHCSIAQSELMLACGSNIKCAGPGLVAGGAGRDMLLRPFTSTAVNSSG